MKAMFKKILTFFLTGVIFITSSGFGLIEHFCFMEGKKSTSLYEKDGCCPKKESATTQSHTTDTILTSDTCCEYDSNFAIINLGPVVVKVTNFFANTFYAVLSNIISFFNALLQSNDVAFSATDSSPPLTGRDILVRHHILII